MSVHGALSWTGDLFCLTPGDPTIGSHWIHYDQDRTGYERIKIISKAI